MTEIKFDIKNLDSLDPFKQFESWFDLAKSNPNIKNPNVMCLATCDENCQPSCRMVSIENFNECGFLFFSSYSSKKSKDLELNPKASACFYWDILSKQVVLTGLVKKMSQKESNEYFKRKPLESRINTLASDQSKVIRDKQVLFEKKSQIQKEIESTQKEPEPENWVGYWFIPSEFDFWQGNVKDFDDRLRFRKRKELEEEHMLTQAEGDWVIERLCP